MKKDMLDLFPVQGELSILKLTFRKMDQNKMRESNSIFSITVRNQLLDSLISMRSKFPESEKVLIGDEKNVNLLF